MIRLIIPIIPTAQMRARHSVRNGFGVTYKAQAQRSREEDIKAFLAQNQPETPLSGPLLLGVKAYMPIPKSFSKGKRLAAEHNMIRPTTKPDLDNLLKNVKDCLTAMRFWDDDKLVVGYLPETGKFYSNRPRWEIEIRELEN